MTTRRPRGLTLVELLVALVIIALVATATSTLLVAAGDTERDVRARTGAQSEVEFAVARITYNLRTAASVDDPAAAGVTQTTLASTTQADASGQRARVYYRLYAGTLQEWDSRYNAGAPDDGDATHWTTLVHNVRTFSVQRDDSLALQRILVHLGLGGPVALTRDFQVALRNPGA